MTTFKAHFDGKVLIPHDRVDLPVDQELTVQLDLPEVRAVRTEKELQALFAEMDEDSVHAGHFVDYSRDSIYGGTIDDPR